MKRRHTSGDEPGIEFVGTGRVTERRVNGN